DKKRDQHAALAADQKADAHEQRREAGQQDGRAQIAHRTKPSKSAWRARNPCNGKWEAPPPASRSGAVPGFPAEPVAETGADGRWSRPRSGQPEAVGREGEHLLDALEPRRLRVGHPPPVAPAGRKPPVVGAARNVAVADLVDFRSI